MGEIIGQFEAGTDTDDLIMLSGLLSDDSPKNRDMVREYAGRVIRIVSDGLLRLRRENPRFRECEWEWITRSSGTISRRDANKFLCACFLDYRAGKTDIWDNVAFFVEDILEDPANVWKAILEHTFDEWESRFDDYNLHPELAVHKRLYSIADRMIRFYAGDGRLIWSGFEEAPEEVFKRLSLLQIPRSVACLVIGALKDEGYVSGPFDIVGDIVDARVIGRMICGDGSGITPWQARRLGRMLSPEDPWQLDRPLYLIGSAWCGPGPRCKACPVRRSCLLAVSDQLGIRPDPMLRDLLLPRKSSQHTLRRWQEDL